MTTDIAPEVETPTLVTQEPDAPVENATPVGDADQQAVADAAPAPEATNLSSYEAEADAWLKEQEGKGSAPQAPEPEQRQGVDPALAQQAIALYRRNHETRQNEIKARENELIDLGIDVALARRMAKEDSDRLNSHHADGLQYAGYEAAMQERAVMVQAITSVVPQAIQTKVLESLKPADGQPNPPPAQIFEAFMKAYAEDAVEKAKPALRKEGFVAGRSIAERTAASANSGQHVQGGSPGRSFASEDALHTAWNNRDISRDVYAREYKRLTGRDL